MKKQKLLPLLTYVLVLALMAAWLVGLLGLNQPKLTRFGINFYIFSKFFAILSDE